MTTAFLIRSIFRFIMVTWFCLFAPVRSEQCRGTTRRSAERADVIIIGGTPAGIAAAIAAAQAGVEVIVIEETRHVGGIVSGGLTSADIGNNKAVGGLFNEFRRRVREFYASRYGENSEQSKDCRDGNRVEAHVAEKVFRDLLAEQPRVHVMTEYYLSRSRVRDNRIEAIIVRKVNGDASRIIYGKVFVDATYEGDLAAKSGAPYRIGRESRNLYGESLAGRIYTKIDTRERLFGSTGEGDRGIEAYCFRIHVTSDLTNRIPFRKPSNYRRGDYQYMLSDIKAGRITRLDQIIQFKKTPNRKFELNSNHLDPVLGAPSQSFDLAEENWKWPEAGRQQRKRIFSRYWSYQEGLLWFLQTDPEVPATIRDETAKYGFCRDEFVDNNNRPYLLYVREARRIDGEYNFTQREEDPDPVTGLPRLHPDSVAVASYSWDSHSVHKYDPRFPEAREGYFVVSHPPLQIPFGVIVPKKVDGLLVPVACSGSHVGYQTIRMEPVFMALGQAAGIAAAEAVHSGTQVRHVSIAQIQAELTRQKGVISYFEDVPPDHPAFAAIQFLGPRGLSRDFKALPDDVLNEKEAAELFGQILKSFGRAWRQPEITGAPFSGVMLAEWLHAASLKIPDKFGHITASKKITVTEFALAVAGALTN